MPASPMDDAPRSTPDMHGRLREVDRLAMERTRARVERALFGKADPARLGRYEIREPIAGGGMGLVYEAYDPELDRKVALKIVHPHRNDDARSRQRLIIEARALAKLDHLNVVKIHDVEHDGQVVIVMELVEGQTLADWEAQARRTWREALAVYLQAGDGLAATHGVDVIHRDFKPSNAIIGGDGRVRVLDFGLARLASTHDDDTGRAHDAPVDLTSPGDVVGTLAYSAPEQLEGAAATATSDQFSFCVSLHRAIEGVSPFEGSTYASRLASIRVGRIRYAGDGRRVPPWLRTVLARGLSADPARRYPAMNTLLAELRRPRGWQRWRLAVLAVGVVLATIVAMVAGGGLVAEPSCDGGAAELAQVWGGTQQDRVARAIDRIGTPYARDVRGRVIATLDSYGTEWSGAHRAACRAHQRGATSSLLFDRQSVCLSQRLGDLRAAVDVLAGTDAASVISVMDVAARMPHVALCTELEWLQAAIAPPEAIEVRREVAAVRSQLSTAEAQARAGRSESALAVAAEASADARRTGYRPVEVEAALAEGRIQILNFDFDAATAALTRARTTALEQRMLSAAVEASARLIYIEAMQSADLRGLERDVAYVLPLSASLQGDNFARPLLLNNIGVAYLSAGRRADASRYFEDARLALQHSGPVDLELTCIDLNLAMLTADGPTREALARGAWEQLRDRLGERHPATLDAQLALAQYTSDPARAFERISAVAEGYLNFHPSLHRQVALAEAKQAFLASELGDDARARSLYATAVARTADSSDGDVAQWHRLLGGELALLQHEPERAIAELSPVRETRGSSTKWWERADALRATVGIGLAEAARGDTDRATRDLEAAIAGYPEVIAVNEDVENRRYLARAEYALAQVLRRVGKDPARVATLGKAARAFYESAGPKAYARLLERDGE